jgi:pyrroloquinoline quinone (PQQ) biosynthesis protein C
MKLKNKLLDHPFYKLWTKGELTKEQISKYSYSYYELVKLIPVIWEKSVKGLNAESNDSERVILEESTHILMWNQFKSQLDCDAYPDMEDVKKELTEMNPSELLGAIHAFEIQQPDVARTKKEGLLNHYGFSKTDIVYFDEHMDEEKHIEFGKSLASKYADKADFEYGFNKGSEIFYHALDRFLN